MDYKDLDNPQTSANRQGAIANAHQVFQIPTQHQPPKAAEFAAEPETAALAAAANQYAAATEHAFAAALRPIVVSPEIQPNRLVQPIKEAEQRLFDAREAALAQAARPVETHTSRVLEVGSLLKTVFGLVGMKHKPVLNPESLRLELIERERALGVGEALYGAGQQFWLGDRGTSGGTVFHDTHETVGDWYYTCPNQNDPKHPLVVHYQTTKNEVHKLYNGVPCPMSLEEQQNFIDSGKAYEGIVQKKLYASDYDLAA